MTQCANAAGKRGGPPFANGDTMRDDDTVEALLVNLGQKRESFKLLELIAMDDELELKFQALEALSEMERPRTVRACVEVLRIFR